VYGTYGRFVSKRGSLAGRADCGCFSTRNIPWVLHQTWKTKQLTGALLDLYNQNQAKSPSWEFKLYDDNDVLAFIKERGTPEELSAYQLINPRYGAARADFFRYFVLYHEGGAYMDIKEQLKTDLSRVLQDDDLALLDRKRNDLEAFRQKTGYGTYEQHCLIFAALHPYLRAMLDRLVKFIHDHCATFGSTDHEMTFFDIGWSNTSNQKQETLRVTGPDALAVAIHDVVISYGIMHREVDLGAICHADGKLRDTMYGTAHATHYANAKGPLITCPPYTSP